MRRVAFLISALILPALVACSSAVAGIETTNGATVVASSSSISGQAPVRSQVWVCDSAYIPIVDSGFARAVSVDDSGRFTIGNLPPGAYTVIVKTQNHDSGALFQGVRVGSNDTAMRRLLEPTGSIEGTVVSASSSNAGVLVFLVGTEYYQILPRAGSFDFGSVPAGTYELQACALALSGPGGGGIKPTIVSDRERRIVEVKSGGRNVGALFDLH